MPYPPPEDHDEFLRFLIEAQLQKQKNKVDFTGLSRGNRQGGGMPLGTILDMYNALKTPGGSGVATSLSGGGTATGALGGGAGAGAAGETSVSLGGSGGAAGSGVTFSSMAPWMSLLLPLLIGLPATKGPGKGKSLFAWFGEDVLGHKKGPFG